ncbi:protein MANNAN SYNTHESIS-RELATED 1-like [Nymphaea colorata]|nr:protein MANNAN SYNTHESIS-RELATED 1-like [Nymphaea colorata]
MAVDPRQILAGFLTLTMFFMLVNMIKRDHFDTIEIKQSQTITISEKPSTNNIETESRIGLWKENDPPLRHCWSKLQPKEKRKGYITLTLINGAHYHLSQIADAVAVARYLGATLVVPDIQGSSSREKRKFGEIYDIDKFVNNLVGVVEIARDPTTITAGIPAIVRIPTRPRHDVIDERVEPIFRVTRSVRLVSYFPSLNMKIRGFQKREVDSAFCLGMFGTLDLQPELLTVADQMIEKLRSLTRKSDGHFIAIDLRLNLLQLKGCKVTSGRNRCFSAQEIGNFLRKTGFTSETVIYLTQSKWHKEFDPLKSIFPRTYTKESVIPGDKMDLILDRKSIELEAIDFHICTHSDIFVPAIPGLFYANVVGRRIAAGRTQILVPTSNPTSGSLSRYVSDKSHLAYSCLC